MARTRGHVAKCDRCGCKLDHDTRRLLQVKKRVVKKYMTEMWDGSPYERRESVYGNVVSESLCGSCADAAILEKRCATCGHYVDNKTRDGKFCEFWRRSDKVCTPSFGCRAWKEAEE